jgi:23S rRNA pseudouridine1911/1915/1917 synthase
MKDIFICPEGLHGRADKILAQKYAEFSRSFIKESIEDGNIVRLDGSPIEPKSKIGPGDHLKVNLTRPPSDELKPYIYDLSVLYEDDYIIVINKDAGMVVHPGDGTDDRTLVHALLNHCPGNLSPIGAPLRPGIVHRLDKETSGVMVVAKTEPVHLSLVDQFTKRETRKLYQAIVCGEVNEIGEYNQPIGRHPTVRVKMAAMDKGKSALTRWKRIQAFGDRYSHVECEILTGRTHQIRVHFSADRHPLAGDKTYGGKQSARDNKLFSRLMLHAWKLTIYHPVKKEPISLTAPLPPDFQRCLMVLKTDEDG